MSTFYFVLVEKNTIPRLFEARGDDYREVRAALKKKLASQGRNPEELWCPSVEVFEPEKEDAATPIGIVAPASD